MKVNPTKVNNYYKGVWMKRENVKLVFKALGVVCRRNVKK